MILFGKSDWKKAKPFSNKEYQYSYEYFYTLCKKNNIQMYRASYEWYDYKKHIFKHAWIYEGEGANWKKVHNIIPDLIYDKTKARLETYLQKELMSKCYSFINDLSFTRIVDDKFITSLIFPQWSKKSWVINSKKELALALPKLHSSKIVIKPINESGGKDVQILKKSDTLKATNINKEYLVQEFIDSSKGVPGVSKKMHDLRLVFVNNKIIYAYIREPKKGSFLANLAQGGSLVIVPENKLPRSLNPIIKQANDLFATFNPRVYSIDFMFDEKKRPWIVELNSMPGLFFTPEEKPYMLKMYQELLEMFKKKLD
ncbi:MAG: Prokaryotic glutathione synthetase, ATP-grasp domain family [Candidatus Moranbacteria bacterium GW2011_GWF2_36_839]|nr:MAG: Prokaryotic glutathione synthetase, ATP-grasp domain family [Candidatus Moranbacteria bacterium GW2011_GWF1_36_78]KKQ16053.1 MAG: Prokaryotic glutathione synthetase, ATP-grasp domain family [Candidatus Moranbacteria bacterium GW2011_GWF2_36_839]